MSNHKGGCCPLFFCQFQELCCKFTHRAAVGRYVVRDLKAVENGKQRQGVFRRLPLRLCVFDQRRARSRDALVSGAPYPFACICALRRATWSLIASRRSAAVPGNDAIWTSARELRLGLDRCRASERTLSRLPPKVRRLLYQTGLSAVSRQKLRLDGRAE